ncbi:MAG: N-acetylmuramoyl-L-alanine amidase [Lachnospiraceae bacterium]|nr:N-acetylmuramoyl-L-alanine amidase [Lachnospiraceae bacterium]
MRRIREAPACMESMEDTQDLRPYNPIWTAGIWGIFLLVWTVILLNAASHKTVVIAEGTQAESSGTESMIAMPIPLKLLASDDAGMLYVPLPEGSKADQIYVENRYLSRSLDIHIRGVDREYYGVHPLYGDLSDVKDSGGTEMGGDLTLTLTFGAVREYRTVMNGNTLEISMLDPKEAYDTLVVLDPGTDPEGICYAVASQVALFLENDTRVYLNETGEARIGDEAMREFVRDAKADLYIALDLSSFDDVSSYGISARINETWFTPGFGNPQLADALVRHTALRTVNRGRGIEKETEGGLLSSLELPAARLYLGAVTNEKEHELLLMEEYQKRLAQGIAEAIREAKEE